MSAEQAIQIYSSAHIIASIVMTAGFGLAVFAFFRFRIPAVCSLMRMNARTAVPGKKPGRRHDKKYGKKRGHFRKENNRYRFEITEERIIVHTDKVI